MSGLADALWDDIDLIRRDADELMDSSWTGNAADSHAVLWAEWVDSARKMCGALTEDAALLDRVAIDYTAADKKIDSHVCKNGKHLGEYDPNTGLQTKPADPTRNPGR